MWSPAASTRTSGPTTALTRRSKTSTATFGAFGRRCREVGVADRALDGRAVGDAAQAADDLAIEPDGLPAVDRLVVRAADDEGSELPVRSARLGRHQRVASDERAFAEPHEHAQTGLERRVLHRQVGAVVAVALLHAQRVERAIADGHEPERSSGRQQSIPHRGRPLERRRQLPAELARVADPGTLDGRRADVERPGPPHRDRVIADLVRRGAGRDHDVPRPRPPQPDRGRAPR